MQFILSMKTKQKKNCNTYNITQYNDIRKFDIELNKK
jgi:hypothetical protein